VRRYWPLAKDTRELAGAAATGENRRVRRATGYLYVVDRKKDLILRGRL